MQRNGEATLLTWQTAIEYANRGFHIEHSTNGNDFQRIDWVEGIGTTFTVQSYRYIHDEPVTGLNYYRLLQEDLDGTWKYSVVKTILF